MLTMQLFAQPGYYSMATRAWAKLHTQTVSYQGIPAVYEWSCQALT